MVSFSCTEKIKVFQQAIYFQPWQQTFFSFVLHTHVSIFMVWFAGWVAFKKERSWKFFTFFVWQSWEWETKHVWFVRVWYFLWKASWGEGKKNSISFFLIMQSFYLFAVFNSAAALGAGEPYTSLRFSQVRENIKWGYLRSKRRGRGRVELENLAQPDGTLLSWRVFFLQIDIFSRDDQSRALYSFKCCLVFLKWDGSAVAKHLSILKFDRTKLNQ